MGPPSEPWGAIDVGGTWTRWAVYDRDGRETLRRSVRTHTDPDARTKWLSGWIDRHRLEAVGVSAGGTIDPATGAVVETKSLIAYGDGFGWPGRALNDGLATAWGHACHPRYVGRRVFTLALGTGVGAGFVSGHGLHVGPSGAYPRLNDIAFEAGATIEEAAGGRALEEGTTNRRRAVSAALYAVSVAKGLFLPDVVVVCGGVGLSGWMRRALGGLPGVEISPYGQEAGLMGARAIVRFPPEGVFPP
jgi:N-acetylmannosamine-6-phosphate 2-epimerase/N-acetylmannosamine kinase